MRVPQLSMKRFLPFIIIAVVLIAALIAILMGGAIATWMSRSTPSDANRSAATPDERSTPAGAQPPNVRGNPNAPVTVEEFADFQCPSCGAYHPELKKIEAEYGD